MYAVVIIVTKSKLDRDSNVISFEQDEVVKKLQPLLDENNMELSLHQHIGGDDRNITHWALESHKDYATMLKTQQKLMQSPEFSEMFMAMGAGNVSNPWTIGRTILKVWNAPTSK